MIVHELGVKKLSQGENVHWVKMVKKKQLTSTGALSDGAQLSLAQVGLAMPWCPAVASDQSNVHVSRAHTITALPRDLTFGLQERKSSFFLLDRSIYVKTRTLVSKLLSNCLCSCCHLSFQGVKERARKLGWSCCGWKRVDWWPTDPALGPLLPKGTPGLGAVTSLPGSIQGWEEASPEPLPRLPGIQGWGHTAFTSPAGPCLLSQVLLHWVWVEGIGQSEATLEGGGGVEAGLLRQDTIGRLSLSPIYPLPSVTRVCRRERTSQEKRLAMKRKRGFA